MSSDAPTSPSVPSPTASSPSAPPAGPAAPLPNRIVALAPEIAEWRRDLHQHPELGYEETRTAALVAEKLKSFGFDQVETGVGGTGVVGMLYGQGGAPANPDDAIMLRADMDALPMTERNEFAHRSRHDGKMHACGHDGHTAMLLGAAKHLAETRNFSGAVMFCFQPAEEGGAGAQAMLDDGLFHRFPCSRVFGMHNWPGMPVGAFAVRPGPVMAAANAIEIVFRGRGGHAAKPERARDPIVAAAHFITAAQTLVSRGTDPLDAAVVSITTIEGGSAFNVIPDEVRMRGTVRSFKEAVHTRLQAGLERLAAQTAAMFEMEATVTESEKPYPPTVNDAETAAFSQSVLTALAGADQVRTESHPPTMGGEDFSFFAREKPGCFIFLGNGDSAPLHNVHYDFNDAALPFGVAYWTKLVETALPNGG